MNGYCFSDKVNKREMSGKSERGRKKRMLRPLTHLVNDWQLTKTIQQIRAMLCTIELRLHYVSWFWGEKTARRLSNNVFHAFLNKFCWRWVLGCVLIFWNLFLVKDPRKKLLNLKLTCSVLEKVKKPLSLKRLHGLNEWSWLGISADISMKQKNELWKF